MKSSTSRFHKSEEGKSSLGCISFIVMMVIVVFLGFKFVPVLYNNSSLDGELKRETSRLGANGYKDQNAVIQNIVKLAEKNGVRITKDDVKISRFSGTMYIDINYEVPIDLIFFTYTKSFHLRGESFTMGG